MEVILSLVATSVLVLLLRKPIARYPVVFYVLAILVDILFLTHGVFAVSRSVAVAGYPYVGRALVGLSLFVVVMYIGALADGNQVRRLLMPIRGELSVIACLLVFGHVINYLRAYIEDILGGFFGMPTAMIFSLLVSTILLMLLIPLAITSLKSVRGHMNPASWKRLQKASYVFFGLIYVHIMLMLVPTISSAGQRALLSIVVYTVVFLLYAVLRTLKVVRGGGTIGV